EIRGSCPPGRRTRRRRFAGSRQEMSSMRGRAFAVAMLLAIACSGLASACSTSSKTSEADTLRVLAGSELKDMQPILDDAKRATGIEVVPTYAGSLDGAETVAAGGDVDGAWFASDRYLALAGAGSKILARKRIALSPVIVGVRDDVAKRLGWS